MDKGKLAIELGEVEKSRQNVKCFIREIIVEMKLVEKRRDDNIQRLEYLDQRFEDILKELNSIE
jgi:hypothetical protein